MTDSNIEILRKETFLKAAENSIGSKTFNSLFVRYKDSGKTADILHDADFSCAFFVSSLLYLVQAINRRCATVKTLNMICESSSSWTNINCNDIEAGDILFYKMAVFDDGSESAHVGIALDKDWAVSISDKLRAVSKHLIDTTKIEKVFRYSWVEGDLE